MAEFGIDGRELAVLTVLDAQAPLSQHEAAGQLGMDRTTMVTLIDALEAQGLVERIAVRWTGARTSWRSRPPGRTA